MKLSKLSIFVPACLSLSILMTAHAAEKAASVVFSDGVVTSQSRGENYRVIGKGTDVSEGETIRVGERSMAVLEFSDKTRTTLRPNTELVVELYRHQGQAESDSMFLRLLRGGMRTVTGLIGKTRPEAVKVGTATATIGIRGTQFDARICEGDCAGERHKTIGQPIVTTRAVVARLVMVKGSQGRVVAPDGTARMLAEGGPVFESDIVETGAGTIAVLAFNDRSRVTINPSTRFEVVSWKYVETDKARSNVFVRLITGAVRIATGLIGKTKPESVRVGVANSTIGIRGTGFDLHCTGSCATAEPIAASAKGQCGSKSGESSAPPAGEGLFVATWDGAVGVTTGACVVRVAKGQALFVDQRNGDSRYLPKTPGFMNDEAAPRPDRIEPDYANLFGAEARERQPDGLYAYVRDGHIRLMQGNGGIDLAPGESGYADLSGGGPVRLAAIPEFIENDPYPVPETFDERSGNLIQLLRENAGGLNSGVPGQCTIR